MPTPQFNVRVPERYHDLLRLIVERLRANPDGADALADALSAVCRQPAGKGADNLLSDASTDVPQSILERLAALEEREPRMVRIEALEARIAVLEEMLAGPPATPPPPAEAAVEPLVTGGEGTRRLIRPALPRSSG